MTIALSSCSDSEISPTLIYGSNSGIQLTNLKSDQISYYIGYQAICDESFSFTGDTLVVITLLIEDTLYIEETLNRDPKLLNGIK